MSDYISREAAIEYFRKEAEESRKAFEELGGESGIYADAYNELADYFENFPAADVEPVRRGRWGKKQGGFWEFAACSLCGEKTPTVGITPNYCPNCGAKMDLEGEIDDRKAT